MLFILIIIHLVKRGGPLIDALILEAEKSNINTELHPHSYLFIIPTSHSCTRFNQFDWLKEKFYTSINPMSKNVGTIFLPPALQIHNYLDKNEIVMTWVGIIRNELIFLLILSMCKLCRITHKLQYSSLCLLMYFPLSFTQFMSDSAEFTLW